MSFPTKFVRRVLSAGCVLVFWGAASQATAAGSSSKSADHTAAGPSSNALESRFRPLLAYLRCESPVPRDRFNQAEKPEVLHELPRSMFTGTAPSGSLTFPLRVWGNTIAQIEIVADYGTFALLQHYPAGSSPALLRSIADAGWNMNRSTFAEQRLGLAVLPGADQIGVYSASGRDGDMVRTLGLMEAQEDLQGSRLPNRKGVTVACGYSKPGAK